MSLLTAEANETVKAKGAIPMENFVVRLGHETDVPVLRDLAKKVWSVNLSPLRASSKDFIETGADQFFGVVAKNKAFTILILEESDTQEVAGFLILMLDFVEPLTLEKETYFMDVVIDPKYWGKSLWKPLFKRAEEMARERNNGYLLAMITASNERSLATFKSWGFEIERYQVLKRLD